MILPRLEPRVDAPGFRQWNGREEKMLSPKDRNDLKLVDRAIKIEELKEEAAQHDEFHDQGFWELVYDYEYAPITTDYELLCDDCVEMPALEYLDEDELSAKVWEIIEALARNRVYITSTDHLSDAELYNQLIGDVLHEPRRDVVLQDQAFFSYDLVGSGSDQDTETFFRYYANERDRILWGDDAQGMPERIEPPYDRDRFLPGASEFIFVDEVT